MIEKSKTLPPVPRAHFTSSFSMILGFPSSVSWITDRYANTLGWAGLNLRTFPIRIRYTRAREFVCSACAYIHVRLPVRVAGRHWTYLGFELVRNVGGLVSFLYKWVSPGHRCRAHDLHWFFRSRHLRSHRYSNRFVRERWGEIVYLSDRKSEIDRCRMAGWPSATGCRVKLFSLVPFFPPPIFARWKVRVSPNTFQMRVLFFVRLIFDIHDDGIFNYHQWNPFERYVDRCICRYTSMPATRNSDKYVTKSVTFFLSIVTQTTAHFR